jgi:hypothetical protein
MTLKTTKGASLSKIYHAEKLRLDWIRKLHRNTRKLLDKIGNVVSIDTVSFKLEAARKNTITLRYSGFSEDLARIEKVLDSRFHNAQTEVKFSRITLNVKLLKNCQAAKIAA